MVMAEAPTCDAAGAFAPAMPLRRFFKDAHELCFLVCGKTGVGKSSLVNSLLGYEFSKEGDPSESLKSTTTNVDCAKVRFNDVIVTVYDSPGLQDGKESGDKAYLDKIVKVAGNDVSGLDLVLYCVDMTASRFTTAEIATINSFQRQFGNAFWKKTLLVLTKADNVSLPPNQIGKVSERDYHERLHNTFFCESLMSI